MASILTQVLWAMVLALPIACISWTVTHEELFRELRSWCKERCDTARTLFGRKLFYPFTCGYCFSHYITIVVLIVTGFRMLYDDWRGYVVSGFALVWIANVYMNLYEFLRARVVNEKEE